MFAILQKDGRGQWSMLWAGVARTAASRYVAALRKSNPAGKYKFFELRAAREWWGP